jgi:hypothetical protein
VSVFIAIDPPGGAPDLSVSRLLMINGQAKLLP